MFLNVTNCKNEFGEKKVVFTAPDGSKYTSVSGADLVLINKIDVLPYFDFDIEKCKEFIKQRNPKAEVIPICAKTGEGIEQFAKWIKKQIFDWRN